MLKKSALTILLAGYILIASLPAKAMEIDLYDDSPIIIGGGITAAVIAHELSKLGYDPLVLEKSDHLGGKCQSITCDTYTIDQGAIQLPSYYTHTKEYLKQFNMGTFKSPDPVSAHPDGPSVIGDLLSFEGLCNLTKYVYEAHKYNGIHEDRTLIESFPEIMVSTEAYLDANDLPKLKGLFRVFLYHYGYGELKDVPMYDALSILPYDGIVNLVSYKTIGWGSPILLIEEGYQKLVERLFENSNADVRFGEAVTGIHQSSKRIEVETTKGRYQASYVFMTVPPTEKIDLIYDDPKNQQAYEFVRDSLIQHAYGTTVFTTDCSLSSQLAINFGFQGEDPTMMGVKFDDTPIGISYAYGSDKPELKKRLETFYDTLGHGDKIEIINQAVWSNYYPHPTIAAVKGGFYTQLAKLNGLNIQYAGSWTEFELIERAVHSGILAVKRVSDAFPKIELAP